MRLLLDENISWRLAGYLRPHCAAVVHVRDLGLANSPDTSIWRYAKQHGYDVLTKDEDFLRLVVAEGFPPRVVAVQNAQVPVAKLAEYPLARLPQLQEFLAAEQGVLGAGDAAGVVGPVVDALEGAEEGLLDLGDERGAGVVGRK
ncbi:DUF5615 family PIN-like protein [Hymenobacter jeollabukensis]|uniref:DUF5615 domain-containing protein n=1 Tax=Hymenobacter jeollabukensis TaxID=2025313 RepID=A0A5R8WMS9_9BACT|nr:DUF5615 family PIN-like protein [Hymenobacter jeollabukensis]TLM91048.1 hypothetical protein FDY95_15735 [Hymenobacter jeollabukensis]